MKEYLETLRETQKEIDNMWLVMNDAKEKLLEYLKENYFKEIEVGSSHIMNEFAITLASDDGFFRLSYNYVTHVVKKHPYVELNDENRLIYDKLIMDLQIRDVENHSPRVKNFEN
jgi:hypothetical protein